MITKEIVTMITYERLKKVQQEEGLAIATSFSGNGEMQIFVSASASNDEVMELLIRLSTEIYIYRKLENKTVNN